MANVNWTFSDLVAGYVKSFDPTTDSYVVTTPGGKRRRRHHRRQLLRRDGPQPGRGLAGRRRHAGDAPAGAVRLLVRHLLPGGQAQVRGEAPRLPRARRRRVALRGAGLVGQAGPPDLRLLPGRPVPGRPRSTSASTGPRSPSRGPRSATPAPGDGHDLADGLRLRHGVPADRRGPVPRRRREGHRVPARAPAVHRPQGRHRLLVPRRRREGRPRAQDLRLRVRRRLRRDPGLRADLRAGRPDPDLPHHRRRGDPLRHRDDAQPVREVLQGSGEGRLLLARRPGHLRSARRVAGPEPRQEELELGGRPRAGLPDQPGAGDRRPEARRHAGGHRRHDHQVLPGLRQRAVRPGEVLRGLEARRALGLAAEPGRRRAQPEDRLEPDADPQPATRSRSTSSSPRRSPR